MNRIVIKSSCLAALFVVCIFISLNSHAQSSLTNGLIAYYPFNGNANDESGNGNNGTVSGATLATDRFGNTNSCYLFNGTSSKILAHISNIPTNTQARTLSLWEKFTGNLSAAGTFTPAAWGSNADNEAFGIMAQYGTAPVHWLVQFWGSGEDMDSGVTIDANWHNIVAVYNSGVAELFFDGVLEVSSAKTPDTGFSSLCIGTGIETFVNGTTYFPGYVDDVRVYNRALSTNEVTALYNLESTEYPPAEIFQAVGVSSSNFIVGANYQFETSSNLTNWINSGAVFTATSSTMTNYFPVNSNQLFFRYQQQ